MQVMQTLGVPYSDQEIANGVTQAEEQARLIAADVEASGGPAQAQLEDKEIIAMVAFLQRLGQDIKPTQGSATPAPNASEDNQP
jgi:cytochrome c oxidase cbb3-type subunit I/II